MEITRIPAQWERKKTRIAIYCRVSTKMEEQEDSLEMQREAYLPLIRLHSGWELVGVYSDNLSGLIAEKRPKFMQMINDALEGKIDRILCKSISRFSRNVAECKKYTDMLRLKNVAVEFEKEHLSTDDPASSFLFSLMSTISENESRSISENIRWGYRERFKRGEYNLGPHRILGYDSFAGKLVPNNDAWIVRTIFQQYADGTSLKNIEKGLAEKGVLTRNGTPLSLGGIGYILRNETYRGDKLLRKSPSKDLITRRPLPGVECESRYLKDDHEAIVDDKTWTAVQARIRENANLTKVVGHLGGRPHFLYGKIFCTDCGNPMTRRTYTDRKGEKYKAWVCRDRLHGQKGNGCGMRIVKETELCAEICQQLEWGYFDEERFRVEVKRLDVEMEGIRIVRKKFGQGAFEFRDNAIVVTIPFNKLDLGDTPQVTAGEHDATNNYTARGDWHGPSQTNPTAEIRGILP